jgi:urea transport system substrate-binding protein
MEAAYTSVYLWKAMVEKAKSFDPTKVKAASDGITFDAPEGKVTVDGASQHIYKTARIGKIGTDGLIDAGVDSGKPIKPDPYLKGYDLGLRPLLTDRHVGPAFGNDDREKPHVRLPGAAA